MENIAIILLLLYFVPTVIAAISGKKNTMAIFVLNLLLGWTFVGWVVALVWSFTHENRSSSGRSG